MKLTVRDGKAYINCVFFCLVEPGNGSINLRSGTHPLTTQFSHTHGDVLPNAASAGWLGANHSCDVILGGVRGRDGLIPNEAFVSALLARLEVEESMGRTPKLEILP
jgi:hypothetical protein